jgi:hypothetical protein
MEEPPEPPSDAEMPDLDESDDAEDSSSDTYSSQSDPSLAWFQNLLELGEPILSFGNRDVRLEGRTYSYDKNYWDKLQASGNCLGWPDPSPGKLKAHVLYVHGWSGHDGILRSDSLISHADALNRAFHYSSYYDAGFTNDGYGPAEDCPAHLVPIDFGYYPANLTEDPSLTMSDFIGDEELDRLSRPREQAEDASPANKPDSKPIKSPSKSPSPSLKPSSYGSHKIAVDTDISECRIGTRQWGLVFSRYRNY